jgi:hypothetical protein
MFYIFDLQSSMIHHFKDRNQLNRKETEANNKHVATRIRLMIAHSLTLLGEENNTEVKNWKTKIHWIEIKHHHKCPKGKMEKDDATGIHHFLTAIGEHCMIHVGSRVLDIGEVVSALHSALNHEENARLYLLACLLHNHHLPWEKPETSTFHVPVAVIKEFDDDESQQIYSHLLLKIKLL